jgi:hypothetical protein
MAGAFQVGPFQPAFQQEAIPPGFYRIGGYPEKKKRKLIEVEHDGQIYEFENEEDARELIESLAYQPAPVEVKKPKKATPKISLRVNDVPVTPANLRGYTPVSAILANRFDLIYAAARQNEDDEEAILLLM